MRFVRFNHKPAVVDTSLKAKVEADARGVFVQLVKRAEELLGGRSLSPQGQWGKQTAQRFAVSNDPIGAFVKSRCILAAGERCEKQALESEFETFSTDNGLSDKLAGAFFKNLYERFPEVKCSKLWAGGVRQRVITGLSIRED